VDDEDGAVLPNGPTSFADGKFANWFLGFDERTLGPCLIRNYNKTRMIVDIAN